MNFPNARHQEKPLDSFLAHLEVREIEHKLIPTSNYGHVAKMTSLFKHHRLLFGCVYTSSFHSRLFWQASSCVCTLFVPGLRWMPLPLCYLHPNYEAKSSWLRNTSSYNTNLQTRDDCWPRTFNMLKKKCFVSVKCND